MCYNKYLFQTGQVQKHLRFRSSLQIKKGYGMEKVTSILKNSPANPTSEEVVLALDGLPDEALRRTLLTAFRCGVTDFRFGKNVCLEAMSVHIDHIHDSKGSVLYDLRADGNAQTIDWALSRLQLVDGDGVTIDWKVSSRDREIWETLRERGKSVFVNIEPDDNGRPFPIGKLSEILDYVRRISLGGIICHASLFQCCRLQLEKFSEEGFQYLVTGTATKRYSKHVKGRNGIVLSSTVAKHGGRVLIGQEILSQSKDGDSNLTTVLEEVIEDTIRPT